MNRRGAGIIEVMVGFAVISIVATMSMRLLDDTNRSAAGNRKSGLVKKTFVGAEQVLINQRQCRCNLLGLGFPVSPATTSQYSWATLKQLRTFKNEDTCAFSPAPAGHDAILSDMTASSSDPTYANKIFVTHMKAIIPQLLYRGEMNIVPAWGAPVTFNLMFNTHPVPLNGSGNVVIDSCGVDIAD